jgi:hypothetical protein
MTIYTDKDGLQFECDDENFGLFIIDIGNYYPKVFSFVRQITGKSMKEVKFLLDSSSSMIISGSFSEMSFVATDLLKIGAKTKILIIDDLNSQ